MLCACVTSDIAVISASLLISLVYDILLLRHHQCLQTSINNKTCNSFAYLSAGHTLSRHPSSLNEKEIKKTCKIKLLLNFFDVPPLLFAPNLSSWSKKVAISFFQFYSSVTIPTFLFSDKRKIRFPRCPQPYFPREKFRKLYNSQQRA